MNKTDQSPNEHNEVPDHPTLAELMRDAIGVVDSGIPDLSTNPRHMESFGRDGTKRADPST